MTLARNLDQGLQDQLREIFGQRVTFDRRERRLYDHDVGNMPSLLLPLLGERIPAAVVQPETEAEVVNLVRWARMNRIPLVPRGAATSGYGGVVPVAGGVVVETVRMNRVLEVDQEKQTVRVQPGVVWKDLIDYLAPRGLEPRLVPTSAPGSTVGGWLAQGGGGIGSYRYGWFYQNVAEATVVLPDGEVHAFGPDQLEVIQGAMGTTGIITSVTLHLRSAQETEVTVVALDTAQKVQEALVKVGDSGLEIDHIGFKNPTAVRLQKAVPPKTHHGHVVSERPDLPEKFLVTFAYPSGKGLREQLKGLLPPGAEILDAHLAMEEWAERFSPMKVKRLGPSLVPTEAVVPLSRLADVINGFDRAIRLPFVLEATVVKGGEVILLGFIPHDERKFGFNFAYSLSLVALDTVKKLGGRSYAAGLYLGTEVKEVFGGRLSRIEEFKKEKDPEGLFNPLKLKGKSSIRSFIGIARAFLPVARSLGNASGIELGERPQPMGDVPASVAWYAYSCASCGYCRNVCTLYDGRGWESSSPRGKWYFVKLMTQGKVKMDQDMVDTFLMCTTCERCDFVCQLDLPVEPSWGEMRGELVNTGRFRTFPAFEIMAASANRNINIWAFPREERDAWMPGEIKEKLPQTCDTAYFAGCTASYVETDIAKAAVTLLDKAGVEFTYLGKDEACCGIPMLVAGRWDVFEDILRHNVAVMKERGVKTVITSCPACWLSWHTYYPEWAEKLGIDYHFETKHYSEVLAEKLTSGELRLTEPVNMKVTFHDSCHIGRAGGVYEPPRELIKAIPGLEFVEMEHNRENALCCGSVLTRISEPDPTSNYLAGRRVQEAIDAGADAITALCPCCQFQLRAGADANDIDMPVIDLAALTARGLGIEFPDPTAYALGLWQVFDKMIGLMNPQQMADLMVELMPQMMRAMPGPLGAMMKVAKHIPGALTLMESMIPSMMPLLMPGMMPKVMPDMLEAVGRRVPMPDFMAQQMPDLMPKVMERLMPKMLPQVAPLVAPKMIEYIRNN